MGMRGKNDFSKFEEDILIALSRFSIPLAFVKRTGYTQNLRKTNKLNQLQPTSSAKSHNVRC